MIIAVYMYDECYLFIVYSCFFSHWRKGFRGAIYIYLLFLQSLLDEPNPNSPANNVAAQLYQDNRREYEKRVKAVVEQSWIYQGAIPE